MKIHYYCRVIVFITFREFIAMIILTVACTRRVVAKEVGNEVGQTITVVARKLDLVQRLHHHLSGKFPGSCRHRRSLCSYVARATCVLLWMRSVLFLCPESVYH